jgi:hypothetical protein
MKIENLAKDLDTATMTAVTGGTALTAQVVPTNVQSNQLAQDFQIGGAAPVMVGNDADQSNYSSQESVAPVGSLLISIPRCY